MNQIQKKKFDQRIDHLIILFKFLVDVKFDFEDKCKNRHIHDKIEKKKQQPKPRTNIGS